MANRRGDVVAAYRDAQTVWRQLPTPTLRDHERRAVEAAQDHELCQRDIARLAALRDELRRRGAPVIDLSAARHDCGHRCCSMRDNHPYHAHTQTPEGCPACRAIEARD